MAEKDNFIREELPESFATFEALADFWDTHDLADYDESLTSISLEEVVAEPSHEYVIALSDSLNILMREAQKREGVSINTLVNLWVQEKLQHYQLPS